MILARGFQTLFSWIEWIIVAILHTGILPERIRRVFPHTSGQGSGDYQYQRSCVTGCGRGDQRPKTKDQKEQIEGPNGHVLRCACTPLLSLPKIRAGVYGGCTGRYSAWKMKTRQSPIGYKVLRDTTMHCMLDCQTTSEYVGPCRNTSDM